MRRSKWGVLTLLALGAAFVFSAVPAQGVHEPGEIHGVIATTLVITQDSELTGDVQCLTTSTPCISFGRPGIELELNGFIMTGPGNEPIGTNCNADFAPGDGIQSTFDRVKIEGPGVVQRFRRHGIALIGTGNGATGVATDAVENAVVEKVTSHQNCFSGIWLTFVNKSRIEGVVSARNSAASAFRPCGGICVTNSNDNRVRRSELFGNGATAAGPPPPGTTIPNDFGVGLVGNSNDNVIEENGIGGNINGVALFPLGTTAAPLPPAGNLIRRNVIAGNPPTGVGPIVGADIHDLSTPGSNAFRQNLCLTYRGSASPPPCPNVPRFAGHRNNHGGGDHDSDDD
jgi:Right handed beta helix region